MPRLLNAIDVAASDVPNLLRTLSRGLMTAALTLPCLMQHMTAFELSARGDDAKQVAPL